MRDLLIKTKLNPEIILQYAQTELSFIKKNGAIFNYFNVLYFDHLWKLLKHQFVTSFYFLHPKLDIKNIEY